MRSHLRTVLLASLLFARPAAAQQAPEPAAPPPGEAPPPAAPPARAAPPPAQPAPAARVLTLDDAVRTARAHQPQLQSARAAAAASWARSNQARAGLLPQLGATGSYQRRTTNPTALSGVTSGRLPSETWDTSDAWSFSATASQLVFDFGATSGRFTAARRSAEAQAASARETELATIQGVRSAFFTARAARDLAAVARATYQNQQAHLAQTEAFVRIGTRPPIDLATARANLANAQVSLIQSENNYATARANLNQAMGVAQPVDYEVASDTLPAVEGEDRTTEDLLVEAIRSRPDLHAAERRVAAAEASLSAARGGYGPSLSIGASATEAGTEVNKLRWNVAGTATLSWSIFAGGLTDAQVAEARANVDQATADLETLKQQLRTGLESAHLTVVAARASLAASRDAATNAREQLRLAEGRYRTGAGSAIELSDAQLTATNAEAQVVNAEFQLASARATLLAALGRE